MFFHLLYRCSYGVDTGELDFREFRSTGQSTVILPGRQLSAEKRIKLIALRSNSRFPGFFSPFRASHNRFSGRTFILDRVGRLLDITTDLTGKRKFKSEVQDGIMNPDLPWGKDIYVTNFVCLLDHPTHYEGVVMQAHVSRVLEWENSWVDFENQPVINLDPLAVHLPMPRSRPACYCADAVLEYCFLD